MKATHHLAAYSLVDAPGLEGAAVLKVSMVSSVRRMPCLRFGASVAVHMLIVRGRVTWRQWRLWSSSLRAAALPATVYRALLQRHTLPQ